MFLKNYQFLSSKRVSLINNKRMVAGERIGGGIRRLDEWS